MAASSQYFSAFYGPDFKPEHQNEVVLNEIDGPTLKAVIDYCYCCKIEINDENVDNIMAAASRMEFLTLAHQCESFYQSKLGIENCLKTLAIADTYNLQSLWKDSLIVACENFYALQEADLMKVDQRNFNSIIKEDRINSPEDLVAYRFAQWALHDQANRKKYVTTMAKWIRLEHISEEVLILMYSLYWLFNYELKRLSGNEHGHETILYDIWLFWICNSRKP